MNLLHVTASTRDADSIEHELTAISPEFKLEVSPSLQEAAARMESRGAYDAVLLDMLLPGGEAAGIITHIRQKNLPLAVIAMIGPGDKDPPMEALKAGANDYVVKRSGYTSQLPGILRRAVEHYRTQKSPLRVLYAGNIERIRHELSFEPGLQFEPAEVSQDGACKAVDDSKPSPSQYDAVLLEEGYLGVHILRVLRDVLAQAHDVPAIMMIDPGHEDIGAHALSFGAAAYLIKTGNYLLALPAIIRNAVVRRDLALQKSVLASAEARLRMLIERVPTCVVMLTCDGSFLAINWAGLSLVGARRPEELVGKSFSSLLPPGPRESMKAFVEGVCSGEPDSIQFDWDGLDGKPRHLELRGVPIRRDPGGTISVLGVIDDLSHARSMQEALAQSSARLEELQEALRQAETPADEAAGRTQVDRGEWETSQRELERRANAAEAERDQFQEKLQAVEARLSRFSDALTRKEEQWNSLREGLDQRLKAAEDNCTQLQEKLQVSEASRIEIAEMLSGEQELRESTRERSDQRLNLLEEERVRLQGSLQQSESRRAELSEMLDRDRAQWKSELKEFEQRLTAREEERTQLEKKLRESEVRQSELAENLRVQWESERAEFEQRLKAKEEEGSQLEKRLQESEAHQSESAENLRTQWESERAELEQRLKAKEEEGLQLEKQLQESEAGRSELAEVLSREQMQWESAREGFEHRLKAAEQERAQIRERLQASEFRHTELSEALKLEQARWDSARQESEQRISALEEERKQLQENLQASQSGHAGLSETFNLEQAQWKLKHRELEQRTEALEKECVQDQQKLQASESDQADLADTLSREQARWESARQESDRRAKALEEQCVQLERKLQASEFRQSELAEAFACEQLEWEVARRELERRARITDEERSQLQRLLRAAESRQPESGEVPVREEAQWQSARQDLEQRTKVAEDQLTQLRAKLQAADSRVSELNQTFIREQAHWETARLRLEQRAKAAEAECTQLQETLDAVQSPAPEPGANPDPEPAQREVSRRRHPQDAEDQLSLLKQKLESCDRRSLEPSTAQGRKNDLQEAGRNLDSQIQKASLLEARLAEMTRRLTSIIQKQERESEVLELSSALSETQSMLQLLAGDDIELVFRHEQQLGSVAVGRSEFEKVLTALVVNARDGLPAGGTVTIEANNVRADQSPMAGGSALLVVRYAGAGALPPERSNDLDHLVLSCRGRLQTAGKPGTDAAYSLFLPRI